MVTEPIIVLCVDDESDFAGLTATYLEREDEALTAITAAGPKKGLARLADEDVDCVVSDHEMPGMDGLDFLDTVRETYPDLPFILFTGKGDEEIASKAISAGVTDYLQKGSSPDRYAVLANRIHNAVESTRAKKQRQRHLRAIETAREGISLLDEDERFTYVNQAYADLYGYDSGELIGRHWRFLYPDDEAECVSEEVLPRLEESGSWRGETVGRRANGETLVEDHSLARTDDGGLICIVRDITDQQDRIEKLAFFEELVRKIGIGIAVYDGDGRYEYVNERFASLLDRRREALIGRAIWDIHPEFHRDRFRDYWQSFDEGETRTVETELLRADGSRLPVETSTTCRRINGTTYHFGTITDITERKEHENWLARYERMANTAADMVYILDEDGCFEFVNDAAEHLTGYDREELLGAHVETFAEAADVERGNRLIERLLREEETRSDSFEWTLHTADGDTIPCESHVTLLEDEGEFRGTTGVVRDISQRKQRERELESTNNLLSTLVANIPAGILAVDGSRRVRSTNRTFCDLFDVAAAPDDLVGSDYDALTERVSDVIVESDRFVSSSDEAIADKISSLREEFEVTDGRSVERYGTPVSLEGRETGYLWMYRDVTEQKRAENRFRALFENLPDPAVIVELIEGDAIARKVNAAFEDVFGYRAERVMDESLNDLIVPPEYEEESQEIDDQARSGEQLVREVRRGTADGELRDFLFRNVLIENVEEEQRSHGIYTDITERKRQQRAITDLHVAMRDMLEADETREVGEIAIEAARDIVDLPLASIRLYDEDEDLLRPIAYTAELEDLLDGVPRIEPDSGLVWRAFSTGEMGVYDDVRADPDARDTETAVRSQIILPLGSHGVLICSSSETGDFERIDVTLAQVLAENTRVALNRINREQELQHQKDRLEDFAGVVSHDLRNPLNVAKSHLDLAEKTGDPEHFESIAHSLDRMERIIEDLFTLARHGSTIGETRPVELDAVATRAWSNVETEMATLQVRVDRRIDADPSRLGQFFENLFRNAIEHGSEDVTVRVGSLEGAPGFYVEDTGTGIPPGESDRVFESDYTTKNGGIGLGLAIVEEIATAHDWGITATDGEEGGARFEITGVE